MSSEDAGDTGRYADGLKRQASLAGRDPAELEAMSAPLGDLGRHYVEFAMSDVYSRPGLGLRDRQLATIALLTALGGREPQLRIHMASGLRAGLTPTELEEVIIQTVPFAGFPTAINAMRIAREVIGESQAGESPPE